MRTIRKANDMLELKAFQQVSATPRKGDRAALSECVKRMNALCAAFAKSEEKFTRVLEKTTKLQARRRRGA